MSDFLLMILNMTISASSVILAVLAVRLLLKRLPKIYSYSLWAVVLFRLLCPVSLKSPVSLLPVAPNAIPYHMDTMMVPELNSGINLIDHSINKVLPAATPYSSMNPMQYLLFAGSILWLAGVMGMISYGVISSVLLWRHLSGAERMEQNVYLAENLRTPFVFGFLAPKIYLPVGLTVQEQEYILAHEKVHIRRKDPIIKAAAFLALSLHWFNPLVWAAFVLAMKDMEMSCDEAVIRMFGSGIKKGYSSTLLSLAIKQQRFKVSPLAFGEGEVKGRVKNILNYKKPAFWAGLAALVVVVCVGLGFAFNPIGKERTETENEKPETAQLPEVRDETIARSTDSTLTVSTQAQTNHSEPTRTEVKDLQEYEEYQYLLTLFPEYYDWKPVDNPALYDLDGDGIEERIEVADLGIQGGDGGISVTVSRLIDGDYQVVPFPQNCNVEDGKAVGFPIQMQWDGEQLKIQFQDSFYQEISGGLLKSIYVFAQNQDTLELAMGTPEYLEADPFSGYTVIETQQGEFILVLKQYITGPGGGHSCRIGYGITQLKLSTDNSWESQQYFLPAA